MESKKGYVKKPQELQGRINNKACKQQSNSSKTGQINLSKIPRSEILSIRPKTAVDALRERFPLSPREGRPPLGLHKWIAFPGNSSPTSIREISSFPSMSRGQVGSPLIQRCLPNFTVNNQRILQSPYSALHDPGCFNFCINPTVRKMLECRGFISKSGEVYCNLSEMRQFHEYLVEISNSCVNQFFIEKNRRDLHEIEQKRVLTSPKNAIDWKGETKPRTPRTPNNKIQIRPSTPSNAGKFEAAAAAVQKQKEFKQFKRIEKQLERDQKVQMVRYKLYEQELEKRRKILFQTTMKDICASTRRDNLKAEQEKQKMARNVGRVDAKIKSAREKSARESAIATAVANDRAKKVEERQIAVEKARKKRPRGLSKAYTTHELFLLQKYYGMWLITTRRRKAARALIDNKHSSSFIGIVGKPDPVSLALREIQQLDGTSFAELMMHLVKMKKDLGSFSASESTLYIPPSLMELNLNQLEL